MFEHGRQQPDVLGRSLQHVHFTGLSVPRHHWNNTPQVREHAVQTPHLSRAQQTTENNEEHGSEQTLKKYMIKVMHCKSLYVPLEMFI